MIEAGCAVLTGATTVQALIEAILPRLSGARGPGSTGNYEARCPFHDDKSASFSLQAKSGLWQCHAAACGRRGNAHQLAQELGTHAA